MKLRPSISVRKESKWSWFEALLVATVCGFLFFYGLSAFGLVGADEPRYAQIAREMLAKRDFITPTLYGEPWLEKPALFYWRAMFSFDTFGVHDWAARLPSATYALMMVLVTFLHMRRFRPGAQLDAALITASCAGIIGFAHGASIDMQLAAPFTVALLGWYAWYETGSKFWLFDLYFFLAIATLAKGPVAPFLAGLVVLIFCLLRRDWKSALSTLWLPGVIIYFLIALPWYIAVQSKNPTFIYEFIFRHNLARFATDMFQHSQPSWYYIPIYLLALAPWTFFAIPALFDAARSCWKDWKLPHGVDHDRMNPDAFPEFLVLWAFIIFLFFSISSSKLPGYILPAVAPCTILTADYLQRRRKLELSRVLIIPHAGLCAVILGLFLVYPHYLSQSQTIGKFELWTTLFVTGLCFVSVYLLLQRYGTRVLRVVTLTPIIISILVIMRMAAPAIDDFYSARPVAKVVAKFGTEETPVAVFKVRRDLRYGMGFYRDQKISSYEEESGVPNTEHILIAHAGTEPELRSILRTRRTKLLGEFPAQHVEFFWVTAAPPGATVPLPPGFKIPTKNTAPKK